MPLNQPPRDLPEADDSKEVAKKALRGWEGVAERLCPIIGLRGFRVLYARSLLLTQAAFPCLIAAAPPDPLESNPAEPDFSSLKQCLESQPSPLAADTQGALLARFTGLLNALIGEALTAQLMQTREPGDVQPAPSKRPDNDR